MLNSKENASGFESLIKSKSVPKDTPTKSGAGIAEQKSDDHVSGYRAFVQRQLEKRKQKQTKNTDDQQPHPSLNKDSKQENVSQSVSQYSAKPPIDKKHRQCIFAYRRLYTQQNPHYTKPE